MGKKKHGGASPKQAPAANPTPSGQWQPKTEQQPASASVVSASTAAPAPTTPSPAALQLPAPAPVETILSETTPLNAKTDVLKTLDAVKVGLQFWLYAFPTLAIVQLALAVSNQGRCDASLFDSMVVSATLLAITSGLVFLASKHADAANTLASVCEGTFDLKLTDKSSSSSVAIAATMAGMVCLNTIVAMTSTIIASSAVTCSRTAPSLFYGSLLTSSVELGALLWALGVIVKSTPKLHYKSLCCGCQFAEKFNATIEKGWTTGVTKALSYTPKLQVPDALSVMAQKFATGLSDLGQKLATGFSDLKTLLPDVNASVLTDKIADIKKRISSLSKIFSGAEGSESTSLLTAQNV